MARFDRNRVKVLLPGREPLEGADSMEADETDPVRTIRPASLWGVPRLDVVAGPDDEGEWDDDEDDFDEEDDDPFFEDDEDDEDDDDDCEMNAAFDTPFFSDDPDDESRRDEEDDEWAFRIAHERSRLVSSHRLAS